MPGTKNYKILVTHKLLKILNWTDLGILLDNDKYPGRLYLGVKKHRLTNSNEE